jgi:hypothetical protein
MNAFLAFPALILAAIVAGGSLAQAQAGRDARVPVLLELFTSEGCSSCPPADALLEKLQRTQPVSGADLIVLSEHVDYWDALGWKDPFSSAQFTQRQQYYADKLDPVDGTYTPELVVDGKTGVVGSDVSAADGAIDRAAHAEKEPLSIDDVSVAADNVTARVVAQNNGKPVTLYVALAQDRAVSRVERGENAGRTLSHVDVVRTLAHIISIGARQTLEKTISLRLPPGLSAANARIVAFTQDESTGAIRSVHEVDVVRSLRRGLE